jgi:hypothetical protein
MDRRVQLAIAAGLLFMAPVFAQQSSPEQSTGVPLEQTTAPNPAQPITPGALLQQNQQLQSTSGSTPPLYHEREIPFTLDSGSGYLASVQIPLNAAEITPGPHTLEVKMQGPGGFTRISTNPAPSRSCRRLLPGHRL